MNEGDAVTFELVEDVMSGARAGHVKKGLTDEPFTIERLKRSRRAADYPVGEEFRFGFLLPETGPLSQWFQRRHPGWRRDGSFFYWR